MGVYGSAGVLDSMDIDYDDGEDGAVLVWVVTLETQWEGAQVIGVAVDETIGKAVAQMSSSWKSDGHDWYHDEFGAWQRWQGTEYFLVEQMEVAE